MPFYTHKPSGEQVMLTTISTTPVGAGGLCRETQVPVDGRSITGTYCLLVLVVLAGVTNAPKTTVRIHIAKHNEYLLAVKGG